MEEDSKAYRLNVAITEQTSTTGDGGPTAFPSGLPSTLLNIVLDNSIVGLMVWWAIHTAILNPEILLHDCLYRAKM